MAETVWFPEVPVIVKVYWPTAAAVEAVSVMGTGLFLGKLKEIAGDQILPFGLDLDGPYGEDADLLAVAAAVEAVSVMVDDPVAVGLGAKDVVTPLGRPETARFTLPENPHRDSIWMESVPEAP